MKVNRKVVKKLKKMFNLYNFAMVLCIIVILFSLYIIIKPHINFSSISKEQTNVQEDEGKKEISEDKARKIAQKKFKELGEKKVNKDSLKVTLIQRDSELYYYVCSLDNTVEISQKTGKIIRINSANVE